MAITLDISGIGVAVASMTAGAISATATSVALGGFLAGFSLGMDTIELLSAESRRDRLGA